jgi:hypothetical protein
MGRFVIDDEMWKKFEPLLPKTPKGGRPGANNRLFIEGIRVNSSNLIQKTYCIFLKIFIPIFIAQHTISRAQRVFKA